MLLYGAFKSIGTPRKSFFGFAVKGWWYMCFISGENAILTTDFRKTLYARYFVPYFRPLRECHYVIFLSD